MADETYDGDIANDIAKYGTYGALGASGAVAVGLGAMGAKDYMSPASKLERQKAAHEAAKLGQRAAKAKTLGEAIKKTGKSGIVRSGGKKYHYNKAGVLTHVEQANGKVVYTKAGAEARAKAAPTRKSVQPKGTSGNVPDKMVKRDVPDKMVKGTANDVPDKMIKRDVTDKMVKRNVQDKMVKKDVPDKMVNQEYKRATNTVAQDVAEAAAKQGVVENVKDLMKAGAAKTVLGNVGQVGAGVGVGLGYNYLTDGGSFAGKAGNAEGINRIVASQGGGNQEDMNSRRQEAGEAMAEYSRNLGSNYVTGTLGLAGEIASGGSTLGGFQAGLSELAGGAANIGVSTGLSTILPWNKGLTKEAYQDEIAKNMAMRGNYQREQYMRDEKEFGRESADYIHGDLSDRALRIQQEKGIVHGAFTPDPKENWYDAMKRKEAFGATSRKMDELAAIDDPAQRQAWFEKNKDFLTSADLRGVPVRQRFMFARDAMGGDSARALHYLNTTGEDRMLGVAAAANPVAPNAPSAPMAKAPMSPLAQATQSPYSNPNLFGLNSQSPMGSAMAPKPMYDMNSLLNVGGKPAGDWASNMSTQIKNTQIGTRSAMQQGFNNGMWQDTRPMEQRGMGGNAIAQGQADYMNARGMPTAAQWSAFTNDRQARIKNPELYTQPQEEPSIADSIRGGGMPTQPNLGRHEIPGYTGVRENGFSVAPPNWNEKSPRAL